MKVPTSREWIFALMAGWRRYKSVTMPAAVLPSPKSSGRPAGFVQRPPVESRALYKTAGFFRQRSRDSMAAQSRLRTTEQVRSALGALLWPVLLDLGREQRGANAVL